jgi:hypothetical protein
VDRLVVGAQFLSDSGLSQVCLPRIAVIRW